MKNVWVGTDWHVWSLEHTTHHPYQSVSNIRQLSDSYAKDIQVDDVFIYLGDLCDPAVTDLNELKMFVTNIPGYKILCKGNHDTEVDSFYKEIGFDEICDICIIGHIVFSHFPIKTEPDMINVHGHLHSEKRSDVDDANHINAYYENFKDHPIEISELIQSAYEKWIHSTDTIQKNNISDVLTGRVYDQARIIDLTDVFETDAINEGSGDAVLAGQLSTIDTDERLLRFVRHNIHLGQMGKIKPDVEMIKSRTGSDFDLAVFVHPRLRKLGHYPKLMLFITWEKQNPKPGFVHLFNYWEDFDDAATWFEVSWRGHEGIHEFNSLVELKDKVLEYYKNTPDAEKYTETTFRVVPYSYIKVGEDPQELLKKIFEDSGLMDESLASSSKTSNILVNGVPCPDMTIVSSVDWFCNMLQIPNQVINIELIDNIRKLWAESIPDSSPYGGRSKNSISMLLDEKFIPEGFDQWSIKKFVCYFDILVTSNSNMTSDIAAAIAYWYSQPYYDQLFEINSNKNLQPSIQVQKAFNSLHIYQRLMNDTAVDLLVRELYWNDKEDPKVITSSAALNAMANTYGNQKTSYEDILTIEETVNSNKNLNEILMEPEDAHLFMSDDHDGEKSQKPYKARLSTDDEGVVAESSIISEEVYQLQGIDRKQQDEISKKYGIRAVGHETDDEREYHEKMEREKKERELLAKKKQKDKQLANARKAKKKYAKKRELEAKKAEFKAKFSKKNEDVDISDIPYNTGETNFFDNVHGVATFDFENETGYQFEMIDKVKFFDRINETTTDNKLYPVYVLCVHTGTLLANMIKKATGSHFSHCTISFDSSLKSMYSFGRKVKMTELSNGSFVKESIKNPPYTNEGVTYALYCIPVTADQIAAMKKRLEYFVKNKTRFRYDFAGLIKNYFGIADNPEQSWFCSRFVADIINAGSEPGKPMIREPSLMRPEDFLYTNFAQYVTSGLIKDYDSTLVDKITTKLLRIEAIKRTKQRALQKQQLAMAESCVLDLNPYDMMGEAVFNYQLSTMDEAAVDKFFMYLKSFKIRLDKDGNVIIHRREVDQLDKYFREANSLLKANMKAGNEQGVVDQLCRVYYMIGLINRYYLNSTTQQNSKVKADLKKELTDLRSVMMNVFQQYLKWVTARNPQFNFQTAYDGSKYSDTVNIPNKVISDIGKALITAL